MTLRAKLLSEDAGSDGSYSGLFEAYGLQFTITYTNGAFVPRSADDNPKKPNYQIDSAIRLCQSAAYERREALMRGEK